MKRRIANIMLLLIGGASLNVAVAWGLVQELYRIAFPPTTFRQYSPEAVANMYREVGWPLLASASSAPSAAPMLFRETAL